jgi:hypothetical protein
MGVPWRLLVIWGLANLDLVTNLFCVRRFGAFSGSGMVFVTRLGCRRRFVTFSRFVRPESGVWPRLQARNGAS